MAPDPRKYLLVADAESVQVHPIEDEATFALLRAFADEPLTCGEGYKRALGFGFDGSLKDFYEIMRELPRGLLLDRSKVVEAETAVQAERLAREAKLALANAVSTGRKPAPAPVPRRLHLPLAN